jgi:hypothetical protein
MFVRHFAKREGQRYIEYKERYYSFHVDDIVTICDVHHWEIHGIYGPIIGRHCWRLQKPMCRWTWRQAEKLINELIETCDRWLLKP